MHVRIKQGRADILHRFGDVFLGDLVVAGEFAEKTREGVVEFFEHTADAFREGDQGLTAESVVTK
jgi:hypothetical protein